MKNSPENQSTKCFSGILCSLLCSRSLPTHPSDQFIESRTEKSDEQNRELFNVKEFSRISNPGVVARLMGLDSFPNTPLPPKDRSLGSFLRSRSVNSIDFITQFDVRKKDCHHRRVRTSVSFREVTSLSLNNTVVILDEIHESDEREFLMIKKRPQLNCQKRRKEKRVACKNNEKFEEMKDFNKIVQCKKTDSSVNLPLEAVGNAGLKKKEFHGKASPNLKDKRMNTKPVERRPIIMKQVKKKQSKILSHKGPSENSINKVHTEDSVREVSRPMCSNKTQIDNSQIRHSMYNGEVKDVLKVKCKRKLKNEEIFYYKNMLEELRRLSEENLKEMSYDCLLKGEMLRCDDFDEICKQFGQQILEGLLNQMVDELVILYGKRRGIM